MASNDNNPSPIFDSIEHVKKTPVNNLSAYANNDHPICIEFLYSYRGSEATFNTYRRELERLLHWSWQIQNQSVFTLKRTDIEAYIEFCKKPPAAWIGLKNVSRFIDKDGERTANPNWRPFTTRLSKKDTRDGKSASIKNFKLSEAAIRSMFDVLSTFYNYLITEDLVEANPVLQIRQKSKFIRTTQKSRMIRRLSELQWGYVIETAGALAESNPELHERTLFIMTTLFSMYLRISELASSPRWTPEMTDFFRDHDGNWWFKTVGKGNKERNVSVSDTMLEALKRYRKSLGLTMLPSPGDVCPLIINTRNNGPIKSTRAIRSIVQLCFDTAMDRMRKDNLGEEADNLETATVHWLRHTGISEDVKTRPREHVRDDAGHGSSAITDRYIDVEMRERAQSAKNKKVLPEFLKDA